MKYLIDYEYGIAELYTPSEHWLNRFYELASQCFGIRKSIGTVQLIEETDEQSKYLLQGNMNGFAMMETLLCGTLKDRRLKVNGTVRRADDGMD